MKLEGCAFLADENIHSDVIAWLRGRGSDVSTAAEQSLIGASDSAVLSRAHGEARVVLTHDGDFGTLAVAAGEPVFGIVYLRPGHILPAFTVDTLRVLFRQSLDVRPPFLIVAEHKEALVKIRVRHL